MGSVDMARRRALMTLSTIVAAGVARVTWAQNPSVAIALSDTGKRATRLADEVYVKSQEDKRCSIHHQRGLYSHTRRVYGSSIVFSASLGDS